MKLMQDMSRDELIELVAAVSLRVFAFDYAIGAFRHIYHFTLYLSHSSTPLTRTVITDSYTINSYVMDIGYDTLMSAVMFLLTVPLARLLCRGLSEMLELKPVE
jgi:hypothetical protein